MAKGWIEADENGLAEIAERWGKTFAIRELAQNALDEPGVKRIMVTIIWDSETRVGYIRFEDDAPEGFYKLSHAWTLFARTRKRKDPESRGRFNLGCKIVLSLCKKALITTTKGRVIFDKEGRRTTSTKTAAGSVVECWMPMAKKEAAEMIEAAEGILVPNGIEFIVNGIMVEIREPLATIDVKSLPTEIEGENGRMAQTRRNTVIKVYEAEGNGENPYLHEMGIPIVALEDGDRWHLDVAQRIPLTLDRTSVRGKFLKRVRSLVFNAMHKQLKPEDTNTTWTEEAAKDPDVTKDALDSYLTGKFGEDRVLTDMRDREANHRAAAEGFEVVHPRQLHGDIHKNIKKLGKDELLPDAGKKFPTPKIVLSPDAPDASYPERKHTDAMKRVMAHANRIGEALLDCKVKTRLIMKTDTGLLAFYGHGDLALNVGRLGKKWFNEHDHALDFDLNELLIHEFAHHHESNHLDERYHRACCRLGAKLAHLAWTNPDILDDATYRGIEID